MTTNFEFEWIVEDLVCKVALPQNITDSILDEYDQVLLDVLEHMTHKIHLIVDLRLIKNMPNLNLARKMKHPYHPNIGRVLMVGLNINPIARFMASLLAQMAGISYKSFATYEETFAYLNQMEGIAISSQVQGRYDANP